MLKAKGWDVPKMVEQIKQNTYDRKTKKNAILEAPLSNQEKQIKVEPVHTTVYTMKHGTRPRERHKERNFRYCTARNWNPNYTCLAWKSIYHNCEKKTPRESVQIRTSKTTRVNEIKEPKETEQIDTEKLINIKTGIKHVNDRRDHIVMKKWPYRWKPYRR